jgi:hypothetical protein
MEPESGRSSQTPPGLSSRAAFVVRVQIQLRALISATPERAKPKPGLHGELLMLGFERTFENRRSVPIAA